MKTTHSSSKNENNSLWKKFLYFRKWNFKTPNLKTCYTSGDNFSSSKNKNFLYFSKKVFPIFLNDCWSSRKRKKSHVLPNDCWLHHKIKKIPITRYDCWFFFWKNFFSCASLISWKKAHLCLKLIKSSKTKK